MTEEAGKPSYPGTTDYGIRIEFDQEVLVEESVMTIEALTFLTRLGGIIGVGKEFLWMILFVLTYIVTLSENVFSFSIFK